MISNWFWLIGSNIYILTGILSVKSNKIHVKENQSLTLTCESEGMEFVRLEIGKRSLELSSKSGWKIIKFVLL